VKVVALPPPPPLLRKEISEDDIPEDEKTVFDMTTEELNNLPPNGPHQDPPF